MRKMADYKINGNFLDFFEINHDFTGIRDVQDSQETVSFHNNSTIRIWPNTQTDSFEAHWHAALEIIMPVENYYDVRIGGITYHIQPGEIIVIPPGELHELIAPDSGSRFIFMFDISPITRLKGFVGIQSILSQPLYVTKDNYPQIYEDVYQLLIQMRNEYFNKNEYAELTIFALLLTFYQIWL